MNIQPPDSALQGTWDSGSGIPDVKVVRPAWAISNIVKKAWQAMAYAAAGAFILSCAAVILNPAALTGTIFIIAAVGLAVILGVYAFEAVRKKNILSDNLQKVANSIRSGVVEIFCVIGSAVLYPAALFRSDPKGPVPAGQRPILFVHGYLHNSSGGAYMKARFKHAGLGPFYSINLGNPFTFKTLEEYSQAVQDKVDDIVAKTGCDKVVVIGHSMGGVAAAHAATTSDPEHRIDQLITLGSPLQGTRKAIFGAGKCAKQMQHCKDNTFISELVERIRNHSGRIHCFHSQSDGVVSPNLAATVEGVDNTLFPDHGHLYYMYSDRAIDRMITIIRSGNESV